MKPNLPSSTGQRFTPQPISGIATFTSGWLHGTVLGVEPSRYLLFLRAQETRRKEAIHWAPETRFTVDAHPASCTDLRMGQRVRVHCRFIGHELQAEDISIGHHAPPFGKVPCLHPEPPLKHGIAYIQS